MKKYLILFLAALVLAASCDKSQETAVKTYDLTVATVFEGDTLAVKGIDVNLKDSNTGVAFTSATDSCGVALFTVPVGSYEASVQYKNGYVVYNGVKSGITVSADKENAVEVELTSSSASALVIKEFYGTGCSYVDAAGKTKSYTADRYVKIYNNSSEPYSLDKCGLAMLAPYNAQQNNTLRDTTSNELKYAKEDWVPAANGVWYFNTSYTLQPYSEITISITGAIDHTQTYANSVDLSNADFVCYDPESLYKNPTSYPAPSSTIDETHYLKAATVTGAKGNAWPLSVNSPAFILFEVPKGEDVKTWAADATLNDNTSLKGYQIQKMPKAWILDAIEIYDNANLAKSQKRFTSDIDAGYVAITNGAGYSVYRNVDKEATEALEGNSGRLVYNYSEGTASLENGSTDPSGIDAEASIKKGARIIYLDTNNSTVDLHQRAKASLK